MLVGEGRREAGRGRREEGGGKREAGRGKREAGGGRADRATRACRISRLPPPSSLVSHLASRRHAISNTTFPASPDLIARIASSAASSGKRWVMTGVGSKCPERMKRVIWCQVSYIRRPTTP